MHTYKTVLSNWSFLGYQLTESPSTQPPPTDENETPEQPETHEDPSETHSVRSHQSNNSVNEMSQLPPEGYYTLDQAKNALNRKMNIIGVVTQCAAPIKSKGTDFHLTVHVRDPSLYGGPEPEALKLKFFKKKIEDLPPIRDAGDIVIVKGIKQLVRLSDRTFVDSFETTVFIFKANAIPETLIPTDSEAILKYVSDAQFESNKPHDKSLTVSSSQRKYIAFLWQWIAEEAKLIPQTAKRLPESTPLNHLATVASNRNQRQALLSDIQSNKFYDLTVEVVRSLKNYEKSTLYVTDYTTNGLLYDYRNEDELNDINPAYVTDESTGKKVWKGPTGKIALQITLWPPHSDFVNENIEEGHIINIRNVNIQPNRNAMNIIEGKLHTDRQYEDRVDVSLANEKSELYQSLIARKDAYWKKNLPRLGDRSGEAIENKAKSKGQKKKEKKKREREEAKKKEATIDPFKSAGTSSVNSNIATGYESKQPQPIHAITNSSHLYGKTPEGDHVTYPFMNVIFRTQARVVDFYPPKLEDFTHNLDDDGYNDQPDPEDLSAMDIDSSPSSRWEWAFWLLLEDTKKNSTGQQERIKVLVAGLDAEYLLKLDACDLRRDKKSLSKLREKLFIMWGEVEEKKKANELDISVQPNNKPFECCIQEYGVPDGSGGWTRLHRMFHTVIK